MPIENVEADEAEAEKRMNPRMKDRMRHLMIMNP